MVTSPPPPFGGTPGTLQFGQCLVATLPRSLLAEPLLSIPAFETLRGGLGFCRDTVRARIDPNWHGELPYRAYSVEPCLRSYEKHLESLGLASADPWLLVGARNVGNNLGYVAWTRERGLLELYGEHAARGRAYFCLCRTQERRLQLRSLRFTGREGAPDIPDLDWAVSGQPLVMNGEVVPLSRIAAEAYDPRHLWRLPGERMELMGPHPYRGREIERYADFWVERMHEPWETAGRALVRYAEDHGWPRQRDYLQSAMGLTRDESTVIFVQRHGTYEEVAQTLLHAGAWNALELDQGGSCSFVLGGSARFPTGRTLLASHYFRPRALALLALRLHRLDPGVIGEASRLLPFPTHAAE